MNVKDLIQLLNSCNPAAEVVLRDHSLDEAEKEGNSYTVMEVQEGFFDGEVGSFTCVDEIEETETGLFGEDAVALTFERIE